MIPLPDPATLHSTHSKQAAPCCTQLRNLGVRLGVRTILENVNLHMHCGELTAIIGPNGAGKTTLFKAILGELPHTGELLFNAQGRKAIRQPRMGYVPQKLDLDPKAPISVLDLFTAATSRFPIFLGSPKKVHEKAHEMLAMVGVQNLCKRLIGQLSGGELQRVLLALALTPVPDILLLDEPVSGVDPAGIALFYQMISQLREKFDLSILLISHDLMRVADIADRMVFLNKSILCDGTPQQTLAHPLVTELFGVVIPQTKPHAIVHHGCSDCTHTHSGNCSHA